MTINEILTLFALIAGPVCAVALQLKAEHRKQVRDRQVETMRMLVSTRHLAGDPRWTQAINMVPIDFNGNQKIMESWRDYQKVIRYKLSEDNRISHEREIVAKQTHMIFLVLSFLQYDLSETEIQDSAYAADGLIERDKLMIGAWQAWPRIADALEKNNKMLAGALPSASSE